MITVDIIHGAIDKTLALSHVGCSQHGGEAYFFGVVRELNLGRQVTKIAYDIHAPLAKTILSRIGQAALDEWGNNLKLFIAHAYGELSVNDVSVAIGVSSPHRAEAFAACRYIIEEIKHKAPIWKKEYYQDGESEWVQGHALCGH